MCQHGTPCPDAASDARDLAAVISSHPEQGWNLLCNGVVSFDDGLDLVPDSVTASLLACLHAGAVMSHAA